jgi:hypothetical protein
MPKRHSVGLGELIDAGVLRHGERVFPHARSFDVAGSLTRRGIKLGATEMTLSAAAREISGTTHNGWFFFAVDRKGKPQRLTAVRDQYLQSASADDSWRTVPREKRIRTTG